MGKKPIVIVLMLIGCAAGFYSVRDTVQAFIGKQLRNAVKKEFLRPIKNTYKKFFGRSKVRFIEKRKRRTLVRLKKEFAQ